jgi:high-affinity iron transporter
MGGIVLETFVIGLREGLEGALIVGIVAAFLRQQGRTDALRLMWAGVAIAIAICLAVAVALQLWSASLPEAQQDGLETVVGAAAVVMVTYMIVWMRRHARGMKRDLEDAAATALAAGTAWALIGMAVFAVLREGFETAVFLLAAFNASGSALAAGIGALLGVGVAAGIGYGIYRGGVRLNLARFFRLTGLVLVLVAAGLVATSFHTAHEAGWISAGQVQVVDLGWRLDGRCAPDRRPRPAGAPGPDRGSRLAALPGADGAVRRLAADAEVPGRAGSRWNADHGGRDQPVRA